MRKISLFIILLGFTINTVAQQLYTTSQYLEHNSMLNPAAAGIANKNMIGISYRSQWASFPGNPKTYVVYGDALIKKMNSGVGAYLYRDETGPTSRTGVQLAYSYHIVSRDEKTVVGLGLEARALQYAIDKGKLAATLGNDNVLSGSSNKILGDAGAGIYFTNYKLSIGAAVQQLIQTKLKFASVPGASLNGSLYRHYNFTANYKINTGDEIYIIPNALVRVIENSPSEYEFGVKLNYHDQLWVAGMYRVKQFQSIQVGFRLAKKLAFSYSYDQYDAPVSVYSAGSGAHELGLRFDLDKK
jgi:type IX secretion system PorP/SprF family membrane protein